MTLPMFDVPDVPPEDFGDLDSCVRNYLQTTPDPGERRARATALHSLIARYLHGEHA